VSTLTENLLTYALGRGAEYYDMPAVRKIVRDARATNYRFSSLVWHRHERAVPDAAVGRSSGAPDRVPVTADRFVPRRLSS